MFPALRVGSSFQRQRGAWQTTRKLRAEAASAAAWWQGVNHLRVQRHRYNRPESSSTSSCSVPSHLCAYRCRSGKVHFVFVLLGACLFAGGAHDGVCRVRFHSLGSSSSGSAAVGAMSCVAEHPAPPALPKKLALLQVFSGLGVPLAGRVSLQQACARARRSNATTSSSMWLVCAGQPGHVKYTGRHCGSWCGRGAEGADGLLTSRHRALCYLLSYVIYVPSFSWR